MYSGDSPDELALTYGARELGFVFTERDPSNIVSVQIPGEEVPEKYKVYRDLLFDSDRKR